MSPYAVPSDVTEAAENFVDSAVRHHLDQTSGEVLTECRLCGLWEEHEPDCPVPVVDRWLKNPPAWDAEHKEEKND